MINQTYPSNSYRYDGRSLHGQVTDGIGARITSGEYPVGLPLPREAEFFAAYGVSRPVLREALKALAAKGMIRARPRIGTVVLPRQQWNLLDPDVLRWSTRDGDFENLKQLTQVRLIIEPGAAELAAVQQDSGRIKKLSDEFERMVAYVDETATYLEADRDFHLAILAASRNDYLISIGSLISASLQSSLRVTNPTPKLNRESLGIHEKILRSIRAGNGAAAARASRIQLDDAMKRLTDFRKRSTGGKLS